MTFGTPSKVMQVLNPRTARALLPDKKGADGRQRRLFVDAILRTPFWQAHFYDFNVWTAKKRVEKLRYIHWNPVKRGRVERHEDWTWSSFRQYASGEIEVVEIVVAVDCRGSARKMGFSYAEGADVSRKPRTSRAWIGHPRLTVNVGRNGSGSGRLIRYQF